jgi:hypothetical protein
MASTLARFESVGFYLWGHLKALVSAAPVINGEALQHRTAHACRTIRNYLAIFEWMRWSVTRRVEACTKSHGGFLSPYYKCTISVISRK